MKKLLLALLVVTSVAGCKKETSNTPTPTTETKIKHAVSFDISDFGLTTSGITTNSIQGTTALKDQIKYLQYAVAELREPDYTYNGSLYRYQEHINTEQGFGAIKDSLNDDRYHIAFVGSNTLGKIDIGGIPLSGGSNRVVPIYVLDTKDLKSDIFYTYLDTTVAGKPISKPITMKRMVSKVTIHLKDAIPANAAKFVITFVDCPDAFDLSRGYGLNRGRQDEYYADGIFEFPVTNEYIGKKGVELCSIVYPYYYPEISLQCLDANGNVIAKKVLPKNYLDIYDILEANTQYKFTGYFFGQSANFNITVDSKWNDPVNIPFTLPRSTQRL